MVYTLTFCPCLEYSASLKEISVGADNIISDGDLHVSGSGAVIAQVMSELGVSSTLLGFAAGFTGGEIEGILRGRGVNTDLIYLEQGLSPLNTVLVHDDRGEQRTRFAAQQLTISHNELMSLFSRLERLTNGDMLVLSGAVPPSVPADVYSHIPDAFAGNDVRIVLDIPAEPLAKCLNLHPFLVVTDRKRLGETFGESPQSEEEVISYIMHIQELGAQNVLAYLEDSGMIILLDSGRMILKQQMPSGTRFNETALNALAAGFIVGCVDKDVDNEYSLMLASAAARAAADQRGIPSKSSMLALMMEIMKQKAAE